jgi:hypothetical protein
MPDAPTNPDQQNEAEVLATTLEERLARVVPTRLLAPDNRRPLSEAFVEMLGRLVEFLEQFKPLNQGQMAAMLYFVEHLKLDRVGTDDAFIMLTMVDAAKHAARNMRRARAS